MQINDEVAKQISLEKSENRVYPHVGEMVRKLIECNPQLPEKLHLTEVKYTHVQSGNFPPEWTTYINLRADSAWQTWLYSAPLSQPINGKLRKMSVLEKMAETLSW